MEEDKTERKICNDTANNFRTKVHYLFLKSLLGIHSEAIYSYVRHSSANLDT